MLARLLSVASVRHRRLDRAEKLTASTSRPQHLRRKSLVPSVTYANGPQHMTGNRRGSCSGLISYSMSLYMYAFEVLPALLFAP